MSYPDIQYSYSDDRYQTVEPTPVQQSPGVVKGALVPKITATQLVNRPDPRELLLSSPEQNQTYRVKNGVVLVNVLDKDS